MSPWLRRDASGAQFLDKASPTHVKDVAEVPYGMRDSCKGVSGETVLRTHHCLGIIFCLLCLTLTQLLKSP